MISLDAFVDEFRKIAEEHPIAHPKVHLSPAQLSSAVREKLHANKPKEKSAGIMQRLAGEAAGHKAEVAGLGILAAMPVDTLQAKIRAKKEGLSSEDWEKKSLLGGETGHSIADITGLGVLAAPSIAHLRGGH